MLASHLHIDSCLHSHRSREGIQCLVEVVHLRQNAESGHNGKDVGGCVDELVVAANGQFHRNTEGLDGHDGNRSNSGANRDVDERVLFAIDGRNSVDHQSREDRNCDTVEKES